jgi:mannobiose 2-epimerase
MALTFDPADFRQQVRGEVMGNILPFWMAHVVDKAHGGFYGAVTHDLQVHHDVPRSAILCARILWTYAAAYRRWGAEPYLSMAQWAYDYLTSVFWDQEYGGVYWHVDSQGHPVADRKHHYAQAFAIYGLSEYYRATQEPHSLRLAQRLYHLLETHAYDPVHGGYIEGSSREWDALADMRLSDKEPHCRKSMNTLLHILEAYTNLLQVWGAAHLQAQLSALLELFLGQIVDPGTKHYRLFFDDGWHSLLETVSFGHDIEGSWLLVEAADAVGDPALLARAGDCAVRLATAVYREGRDADGSLFSEAGP